MTTDLRGLRQEISRCTDELAALKQRLATAERTCPHNSDEGVWSAVVEQSREKTEYRQDLLHPIKQGVHLDYPVMPVKVQERYWTRTCQVCGLVQETTRTEQKVTRVPSF